MGLVLGVRIAVKYAKVIAYSVHCNGYHVSFRKLLPFAVPNAKNDLEEESRNCVPVHSQPYLRSEKLSSK